MIYKHKQKHNSLEIPVKEHLPDEAPVQSIFHKNIIFPLSQSVFQQKVTWKSHTII